MKKKLVTIMAAGVAALSMVACGAEEAEETAAPVQEEATEDVEVAEEPEATAPAEDAGGFDEYVAGLTSLKGTSFTMNGIYMDSYGMLADIQGESGNLCYMYENDNQNLITADYTNDDNTLTFTSYALSDGGELEEVSTVSISDFIEFNDSLDARIALVDFSNGKHSIMVESNSCAYTYADGVKYNIRLVEIGADGTLDMYYDEGLAGSGDEDITSVIRASFNEATGSDYTKEIFEDAFYNCNLLEVQEGWPVQATVSFKSYSGELADQDDWDGASEIASKIYEIMEGNLESVEWGKGSFE